MSRVKTIGIITLIVIFTLVEGYTQCPMCKMAAESNLENGGTAGQGLNTGILYMLMMPYLLVAILGYLWYRNRKSDAELLEDQLNASSAS